MIANANNADPVAALIPVSDDFNHLHSFVEAGPKLAPEPRHIPHY